MDGGRGGGSDWISANDPSTIMKIKALNTVLYFVAVVLLLKAKHTEFGMTPIKNFLRMGCDAAEVWMIVSTLWLR